MDNRLNEQIKNRLPIAEVLSTYITLEPSGTQFKARCPFHNEKTASFSVSPERGLFYCFGCGAKGDIFTFVEQFEGVDFKGALKILADRAGIPLTTQNTNVEATDSVYDALESTTTKYQSFLKNAPAAMEYLQQRGVTAETIEHFRIGYAPTEWRSIASGLADVKSQSYYERAGITKKTEKGYYDRFRGRIMFPMMDSSGRVVAFSGRIFPETPEGPKYLNSPETEVFQKSRILFGFDKAKLAIKKHNFAILVEGQMDLVLSHQAGFKNTVATSGTAVSETIIGDSGAQLTTIARLTPNIFLAFDGDSAGQKALERAALVTLSLGMNPKVVALPEGMDPADFLKEVVGAAGDPEQSEGQKSKSEQWKQLLKQAEHFILHTLHSIQKSISSAHQLKLAIRARLFPFLMRVQSAIERQVYINTIAAESSLGIKEVNDDFVGYANDPSHAKVPVDEVTATAAIVIPISQLERFIAITELFPDEAVLQQKTLLTNFRFNDVGIIFPTIEDTHKERIIAVTEREFATLDVEQRAEIVTELSNTIIAQFLEQLRFEYAMKMNEAKQQKNDEQELHYLALLQQIHQRRHSAT
jgi:DNA primase catalytic core